MEKITGVTNARLDVLKLVDNIAKQVETDIIASFFSSGDLSVERADRNLKKIQGRMETLRMLVQNSY